MYKWTEDLCTGYDEIDEQHRKLFTVCARIEKIVRENDNKAGQRTAIEAIKYLKQYANEHFMTEEAFQRSIGYEDYEIHKKVHDSLREWVVEYECKLIENDFNRETILELVEYVEKWLYEHIMGMDQKIKG